jgi:uncharacterized membrane protein
MLTGFLFWFMASLGFWANSPGAIVVAWLAVLGLGGYAWQKATPKPEFAPWWREHRPLVLLIEALFILLFVGLALFRAHEPEIRSTEKPMEFMFINSIRESENFPPNDGWLSGHAISYYYFGYVITAGLADLSGVNTGLAFGLMLALIFALTGIGAAGLAYDLTYLRALPYRQTVALGTGWLAMVLLIVMGNLGAGLIELPWNGSGVDSSYFEVWDLPERSRLVSGNTAIGWQILATGERRAEIDSNTYTPIRDRNADGRPDWEESDMGRDFQNWDFWWWFRYSRVVGDDFLNGDRLGIQPITEFPHFSFILGDLHPHVLALPFALLALSLAAAQSLRPSPSDFWSYPLLAIFIGGMAFMNSWDAVYILFFIGAEALRRLRAAGRLSGGDWLGLGVFSLMLGALIYVAYFPWIWSFNSQAGGFYLNLIWVTPPPQIFIMFGAFLLLLLPFLGLEFYQGRGAMRWRPALGTFAALALLLLILLPWFGTLVYQNLCEAGGPGGACLARDVLLGGENPETSPGFWDRLLDRRLSGAPSHLLLLGLIVLIGYRLFGRPEAENDKTAGPGLHPATAFALLATAAGLVLILSPDFIYLVDNFRVRINTVFKFYYQAWVFLSLGGAYALAVVCFGPLPAPRWSWAGRALYAWLGLIVIGLGLVYPLYAGRSRALQETGRYGARANQISESALTLDGRPQSVSLDEYTVVQCLLSLNPTGEMVVAEAPFNGGYNMNYGRVATLTGVPNLLGWINHQGQWRGPSYETATGVLRDANGQIIESREILADRLYTSLDWVEVERIIARYGIDYIMVGGAERDRYANSPDGLAKFSDRYLPICQAGEVRLYQVGG